MQKWMELLANQIGNVVMECSQSDLDASWLNKVEDLLMKFSIDLQMGKVVY